MRRHRVSWTTALTLWVVLGTMLLTIPTAYAQMTETKTYFEIDNSGKLIRPEGYREWIFVATPVTPNDMNDGKAPFPEFHSIYMDPESWAHWKKTGTFRDGAILVKELISVGSKQAASGQGYFMGEFIGLEATIKSKQHFPNEPGYWGYFSFTTPNHQTLKKAVAAFPTESCNACHATNAADDWVFTQYYPVLRATKGTEETGTGGKRDQLLRTMPKEK